MENHLKSKKFFTEEERTRIREATKSVESRTIGEIAVMVVDSSDRYIEAEVIGGILVGSLLSLIVSILFFHASLWAYIPLSLLFFFPAWIFFKKVPAARMMFMGVKRREETVRERAVRAFYEKGLYKTRKNTGVLFLLSLLEHKVWVLADRGIYEKIDQETLNRFAKNVSQGVRDDRACDALCQAFKEAGELLDRQLPITTGDRDELSNEVMVE